MFNIVTILEPRNKENENSNIKRENKGYKICKNVNNHLFVFRRLEKELGNNKNMG